MIMNSILYGGKYLSLVCGDMPYMYMYLVVNVENLKLYGPPMIMDEYDNVQVPFDNDFSPNYLDEFQGDVILDRRVRNS